MGIYRLCGATTKKNILRLAFEESADIVDLSSMNVPDINVITSEFASSIQSFNGALTPTVDLILRRPFEGVPAGAPAARVLGLPLPDARGRDGRLPARRPRRQRQTHLLDPGLSSEGQQSTPHLTFLRH